MRTVPILRDLADHRVQVLRKMRTGALPPEIYLGCYFAGPQPRYDDARAERSPDAGDSCRFGTRDAITMRLRDEILMYYADAIAVILKNGDYASQELRDLERQALRLGFPASYPVLPDVGSAMTTDVSFVGVGARCPLASLDELLALELLGGCLDPVFHSEGRVIANVGSWVSLVRLIAYEIRAEASPADRANAFVELADWHLLSAPADRRHFEPSTQRALELYERALGQLQAGTAASEAAALMFSPELPVTLPITAANPFTRAAEASARYLDAAFSITKLGRGEQIEILPTSQGATRADERDLTRLIEGTSFRPRFVDGALAASARVVVRYALDP